jgi:hypothetical protein
MGIENNNAVLATTWNESSMKRIKDWIAGQDEDLRGLFTIVPALSNDKATIVLCPDGSKEGWETSNRGDDLRERFIAQLSEDDYEDGSSPWKWVEVGYGEYGQKVLRGNNVNCYGDEPYAT